MIKNDFDEEIKYKLYRSVREILHPTISKRNISNYKIILDEDILPIRIYYPKKISNIKKIIIYIKGDGNITECTGRYSDICKMFSEKTNNLVIAIEYNKTKNKYKEMYQKIYDTVKYLYKELERNNIENSNITLVGDSTGCNIITGINYLNKNDFSVQKEILFYPTISLEYFGNTEYNSILKNSEFNPGLLGNLKKYYSYICGEENLSDELLNPLKVEEIENKTNTMVLVGNVDLMKDEAKAYSEKTGNSSFYVELPFLSHGFLKKIEEESEQEIFDKVNEFLI